MTIQCGKPKNKRSSKSAFLWVFLGTQFDPYPTHPSVEQQPTARLPADLISGIAQSQMVDLL